MVSPNATAGSPPPAGSPHPPEGEKVADRCIFVILGVSGDLTRRKLIPALFNLRQAGMLSRKFAVVGVARRDLSAESLAADWLEGLKSRSGQSDVDPEAWSDFCSHVRYCRGAFDDPGTYRKLKELLGQLDTEFQTGGNYLFYLATPPAHFRAIVENLGAAGLAQEDEANWRRVIVEKPFGTDLESAHDLNRRIAAVLAEKQIYRIDHYLGKETVQNILVFRFGNGIFEPIWNRRYIDHVQITVAETIGVEGRGSFYEQAGALRDVVQNHMLSLMALIAMEPPPSISGESVRREKTKVLDAIRPMTPEEVLRNTVRGQYGPGTVRGKPVTGYRSEKDVAPESPVETYAALRLVVENWRWAGVPFFLRSGKRMPCRSTEIAIVFRAAPIMLYGERALDRIGPNRLIMRIQPDEGITLEIRAKRPGPTVQTQAVGLAFHYADLDGHAAAATGYERLLYDCMVGDQTLYHRTDMVEAAWKIATPILDVWKSIPPRDFPNYSGGTWGPAAADRLLGDSGHQWWIPDVCAT